MKILVDTNVILDIVLERQPFFEHSAQLLQNAAQLHLELFLTATTITDLYYIVRKAKDRQTSLDFIRDLLNVVEISAVDKSVVEQALQLDLTDFEDAVQVGSARQENIKIIVTRNEADFSVSGFEVYSPESFLKTINP